jgi:FkbM family methyltransferase
MTTDLSALLRGAAWARQAGGHLRWRRRLSRADGADRSGRGFAYMHPIVGRFAYHPGDYLSRRLFLHNDFERAELAFAVERARHGGTIVDVGANIGVFTVACARAAGKRGHVIALEPGSGTFDKLSASCAAAGVSNVTLVRAAASRTAGRGWLAAGASTRDVHQHLTGPGASAAATPVDVTTIDEACGARVESVTLMKIDVEGHEVAALEGASRLLGNGRATLIVEFNPSALMATDASPSALWELLERTHGCSAVIAADGSTRRPVESSVAQGEPANTIWEPR